jgi:hypothetical protein
MLREEGSWVKFFTRPKRADVRREDDGERKKRFSGLGFGEEGERDEKAKAAGKAKAAIAVFVVVVTDLRNAILFLFFFFKLLFSSLKLVGDY